MKSVYTLIFLTLCTVTSALATHIRAGEISVQRVNCTELTFLITFTGYEDSESPVDLGPGEIFFGDGTSRSIDPPDLALIEQDVADGVTMKQFRLLHTYEAAGTYIIRFQEFNRNEGVLNMTNSVNTAFYVETMITIDPFYGCNNTPIFLVPPIDRGARGITFTHNPGAWDPDGDSLAFFLEINRKDLGVPVDNYQFPHLYDQNTFGTVATTQEGDSPSTYKIDSVTGTLEWDAPYGEGEYNVAFSVAEYRKIDGRWYLLGYVVRDMQIIVEVTDNNPPELVVPADTCVEAGTLLTAQILGLDEDDDPVIIEGYGGIFERNFPSPANLQPNPPRYQPVPATADFSWQTLCQHVRSRPYEVQFRIEDNPGPFDVELSAFQTWRIQVVAPAPTGLGAEVVPGSSTASLTWDMYDCGNANQMEVYRRVDSYDFDPTGCNVGIPEEAGYEKIAEVDIGENGFLDNNDGRGLAPGATYCYRLVAVFPEPTGGESYASAEACVTIEADAPVITEVSVTHTDEAVGTIEVSWLPPFDLDTIAYRYDVYRMTGFSGGRTQIASAILSTSLEDVGLNTLEEVYHYEVVAFDVAGIPIDTSATASSVRAEPTPLFQAIELDWEADVPWSNRTQTYPYHYIYRNRTDADQLDSLTFVLIDSTDVNQGGFRYQDDGSFNGVPLQDTTEYCYYVQTLGSYGNDKTAALEPLVNFSQIICAQPNDTVAPCPVLELSIVNPDGTPFSCEEFLSDKPCAFSDFENILVWEYPEEAACDDEIRGFNVYYSRTGEEGTFEAIAFVREPEFVHEDLTSFAGCYRISAVDRSGNESQLSAPICRDNCPQYRLPDVITINGDGINDRLVALGDTYRIATGENYCPRFVKEVRFTVVNRWGDRVYEYDTETVEGTESTIFLNWDGKASNGSQLSEGVYYYLLEVTYESLNPVESLEEIKGFIQITR